MMKGVALLKRKKNPLETRWMLISMGMFRTCQSMLLLLRLYLKSKQEESWVESALDKLAHATWLKMEGTAHTHVRFIPKRAAPVYIRLANQYEGSILVTIHIEKH